VLCDMSENEALNRQYIYRDGICSFMYVCSEIQRVIFKASFNKEDSKIYSDLFFCFFGRARKGTC
jgi:hypothetical protein